MFIFFSKLDKTYSGLQTLGSETPVDIELDREYFEKNNYIDWSSLERNKLQPAPTRTTLQQIFSEPVEPPPPKRIGKIIIFLWCVFM